MSPVVTQEMSKNITIKAMIIERDSHRIRYFDVAGGEVDPTRKDKIRKHFRRAVARLEQQD